MTPETYAHLRELDAARTQGEWVVVTSSGTGIAPSPVSSAAIVGTQEPADAEFIAAAANHMGTLLDAAEASEERRQHLTAALQRENELRAELAEARAEAKDLRAHVVRRAIALDAARAVIERVTALAEEFDHFAAMCTDSRGDVTEPHVPLSRITAALAPPTQPEEES